MTTEYFIDIDPTADNFSIAFKDFYLNHFVDAYGLSRGDVDTYFYNAMTTEEKEIAKRLIRQNLKFRHIHLFKASGILKDIEALPILYDLLNGNSDLSWRLTIGQAIWRINRDEIYADLLRQLKKHTSNTVRESHFEQVTDLKNEESIDMLLDYLNDKSGLVRGMTVSKLNYILTGHYEVKPKFDRAYFLDKQKHNELKRELLARLNNLGDK